jgi:hypothetical protein
MRYFEDAKKLWETLVPKSGQAATVQGELIRAIERLRWEAQNNGNANWDEGFIRFCDYLEETLLSAPEFHETARVEIRSDVTRMREFENPYLDDDLYDRLTDRVVEYYRHCGRLISREPDPRQSR